MSTTAIRPQGVTNSFKVPTDRQPENAARREETQVTGDVDMCMNELSLSYTKVTRFSCRMPTHVASLIVT